MVVTTRTPRSTRSMLKRLIFGACTPFLGDEHGRLGVRTLTGPARGMRFRLDLHGDYELRYWLGNYEREIVDRLQTFVQPGWTIWDVGIFLGYYMCLFARLAGSGGRVVAIEADPRNLARTRGHVEMNGFANVIFVAGAIGVPDAEVDLLVSEGSNSHLAGAWIGARQGDYMSNETRDTVINVKCKSSRSGLGRGVGAQTGSHQIGYRRRRAVGYGLYRAACDTSPSAIPRRVAQSGMRCRCLALRIAVEL